MSGNRETVLIVDDERFNLNVLVDLLSPFYETMVAKSGEQALSRLQSGMLPDIVLLDIMMPGMDGFEACRRIKQDARTAEIPVIFISALTCDSDEERGLELGAVDYISKPFSPHLVKLRVKNHLKLKRQSDLLRELANLDGLTGVPNRRQFDRSIDAEWQRATICQTHVAVILIDVDFFKAYNDNYGHLAGDQCLASIASALASVVKETPNLLARYGGEEFVCLLPNCNLSAGMLVAEQLRSAVEALAMPHAFSKVGDCVSASIGVASLVPSPGEVSALLVKRADEHLYSAKQQGRNRVVGG